MTTMKTGFYRAGGAALVVSVLLSIGCGGLLGEEVDAGSPGGHDSDRNCPVETTYGGFVLATYGDEIHEYTRDGLRIRQMQVPEPQVEAGQFSNLLGFAIDDCGGLYVSRGSLNGWVSMRRPGTTLWEHTEGETFRTNNTALAITDTHIYAASGDVGASAGKIAVFRISDGQMSEIAGSLGVASIAISPDRTLYARDAEEPQIVYVIDLDGPGTARVLTLAKEVGGIAVSPSGDLYGTHHGVIYRFGSDGSVVDSLVHGFDGYGDIDIDRRGNIAAVAAHRIVLTDTSFSRPTSFEVLGAGRLALTGRAWALD